ncbi:vitamin K epoxide reductase family protein [candidate division WWE3 bacterium]|nr:vitamin K epoxide reductase family protein [candidate division WWE3 bacterium]
MEVKKIKKTIVFLIFAGLCISSYLAYYKINANPFACSFGGCDKVQNSTYSMFLNIPVAAWGMLYYVTLLILYLRQSTHLTKFWLLWGIGFSTYLTALEIFVIHAICGWCMTSYFIILTIAYLVYKKDKLPNVDISS